MSEKRKFPVESNVMKLMMVDDQQEEEVKEEKKSIIVEMIDCYVDNYFTTNLFCSRLENFFDSDKDKKMKNMKKIIYHKQWQDIQHEDQVRMTVHLFAKALLFICSVVPSDNEIEIPDCWVVKSTKGPYPIFVHSQNALMVQEAILQAFEAHKLSRNMSWDAFVEEFKLVTDIDSHLFICGYSKKRERRHQIEYEEMVNAENPVNLHSRSKEYVLGSHLYSFRLVPELNAKKCEFLDMILELKVKDVSFPVRSCFFCPKAFVDFVSENSESFEEREMQTLYSKKDLVTKRHYININDCVKALLLHYFPNGHGEECYECSFLEKFEFFLFPLVFKMIDGDDNQAHKNALISSYETKITGLLSGCKDAFDIAISNANRRKVLQEEIPNRVITRVRRILFLGDKL